MSLRILDRVLRDCMGESREPSLWEKLEPAFGPRTESARTVADAARETSETMRAADQKRGVRFERILLGYGLARQTREAVARDLGIGARQFFREKNTALRALRRTLLQRSGGESQTQAARIESAADPLFVDLTLARAQEGACNPRLAADMLEANLSLDVAPASRARVALRLAVCAARLGQVQRSKAMVGVARSIDRSIANGESAIDLGCLIEVAEAQVAAILGDSALLRLSEERMPLWVRVSRTQPLSDARIDTAQALIDIIDHYERAGKRDAQSRSLTLLHDLLGDLDGASSFAAAYAALDAGFKIRNLATIAQARAEAIAAADLASRAGSMRVLWNALFMLVDHNLGSLSIESIYGHALRFVDWVHWGDDARLITRARLLLASIEAQRGRYRHSEAELSDAGNTLTPVEHAEKCLIQSYAALSDGRPAQAISLASQAARISATGDLPLLSGVADLYTSRALFALGRRKAAIEAALNASDGLTRIDDPYHLEATNRDLYKMTSEPRYRDAAASIRLELTRHSGWVADLPSELRTTRRSRPPAHAVHRLTPRQQSVAELVAKGHTNRQIASALGISTRTVDHHVSEVLARLGLRARWQLTSEGIT